MDFIQLAAERYSCRSFSPLPVEQEKIDAILKAGQLAPTACNNQPQKILVLTSDEALEKWSRCTHCHFHEKLVIITCYDEERSWKRPFDSKDSGFVDGSIVTTHMMLEAANLGIGSTWIMFFMPDAVKKEFSLPDSIIPVSVLAMGYQSSDAAPSPRHTQTRDLNDMVTYL